MSALPFAPLESSAPERRTDGMRVERRRLRLLSQETGPPVGNRLPAHLLKVWDGALDANGKALDVAEATKAYADEELRWLRRRLQDERNWLACLKAMGAYDPVPTLCAPSQKFVTRVRHRPDRTEIRVQAGAHPSVRGLEMNTTTVNPSRSLLSRRYGR
jgi:hypothetical protein